MSDIFDHGFDAYSSWDGYDEPCGDFIPDPYYYHTKIKYSEIKVETEKARLFVWNKQELWIPKKICRNLNVSSKTIYIHTKTLRNILLSARKGG